MSEPTPAGWYPAPHANNELRYWDGSNWADAASAAATTLTADREQIEPSAVSKKATPVLAIVALTVGIIAFFTGIVPIWGVIVGLAAIGFGVFALVKKQPKGRAITGIVLGALGVIASIGVTAGITASLPPSQEKPVIAQSAEPEDETAKEEEQSPAVVIVPDVVGLPVSNAIMALEDAGLDAPQLSSFEDPEALVASTSRAAGSEATEGAAISIVVQEKPKLTLGQQNAIGKAQSYLSFAGFSRTGLIDQLQFEGFTPEEATFGADNAGADWNAECAQKAQSYMDLSSFSRQSLYDQLAFEGFQPSEIEFGLAAVGY